MFFQQFALALQAALQSIHRRPIFWHQVHLISQRQAPGCFESCATATALSISLDSIAKRDLVDLQHIFVFLYIFVIFSGMFGLRVSECPVKV